MSFGRAPGAPRGIGAEIVFVLLLAGGVTLSALFLLDIPLKVLGWSLPSHKTEFLVGVLLTLSIAVPVAVAASRRRL